LFKIYENDVFEKSEFNDKRIEILKEIEQKIRD
jgi:hypothetical protein